MKLQPLHDNVLIEREKGEGKTKAGIIIPDSQKERPSRGRVIAGGPGAILDNGSLKTLDVKDGDLVLFGKYSGVDVKLESKEYLLMKEKDIIAVIIP